MLNRLLINVVVFFRILFAKELFSADIYMKSGNVVRLKNLVSFKYKYDGNNITHVTWETRGIHRLLHIDVEQIESIVQY